MVEIESGQTITNQQEKLDDFTPRMGQEFDTEQEAYDFYRFYGWKMGFNVRREYANKSRKTGEITSRKFTCSREGFKAPDKRSTRTRAPQPDTRTGCHANMIIRRKKENGKYEIYSFEPHHNHYFFIESCANPSQRKLYDVQSSEPENSGITKITSELQTVGVAATRGGDGSEGESSQQHLQNQRQRDLKYAEAGSLLNYLQDQSLQDPLFYYAVQLDSEDRVTNIFWADAKMIIDYGHFGDVMSFDNLSKSNTGLRPFASFVGFNHHGETVVFGFALMYDESFESFQWLFETFLHAMAGRKARTVFARQDVVISKAISLAMPGTHHAICIWYLKQNAKKNLGHLFRGECDFMKDFKACIYDYEEEMVFLAAWDAMVEKYGLCDNVWIQKLFDEKEKWAKPYVKWLFSAGMKSTQLNERLYSDLRDHLRSDVDIILFLKNLEKTVNDRRYKELQSEYGSRLKLPYLKIQAPILIQASEVYTTTIFQLFQQEYEEFQSAYIPSRDETAPCREYIVAILGSEKHYKVFGDPSEQSVQCSCRKFETLGFLCSHAIKVLDYMNIKYLPDRYILKRWTKQARGISELDMNGRVVQEDTTLEVSSRYKYLCPIYVRLVARASECEETYRLLESKLVELRKEVDEVLKKQTCIDASLSQSDVHASLSAADAMNESDRILDYSSSASGKSVKKKLKKSKSQSKSWFEKDAQRHKVCADQPIMPYAMQDPHPSGNVFFSGLEGSPNLSPVSTPTPCTTYRAYKGVDLSNQVSQLGYEAMHPGMNPAFTLREQLTFSTFHPAQASSNLQLNQG